MEFANRTIATAMLAIGKVTPLSPEGQPPWPPFSWLTKPHKEIPVLCILVLGLSVKSVHSFSLSNHSCNIDSLDASNPLMLINTHGLINPRPLIHGKRRITDDFRLRAKKPCSYLKQCQIGQL